MKVSIAVIAGIAIVAAGAALAQTQALPHQKPGLWQQSFSSGTTKISDQVCLDAASEAKLSAFGSQMQNKLCASQTVNRTGANSWSVISVCELKPGSKTTTHVAITGDFNSKFTAVMSVTTAGAPLDTVRNTQQTVFTTTWLGPCKQGQRGGDVIMSNGVKVNVLDATKASP
jgi:hypothetical protein